MQATVRFRGDSFVGEIVAWNLEYKGHRIDLEPVREANLGKRRVEGYLLFQDGTRFVVDEPGFLGERKFWLTGLITLRVSSLSEDLTFDVREIDKLIIPWDRFRY